MVAQELFHFRWGYGCCFCGVCSRHANVGQEGVDTHRQGLVWGLHMGLAAPALMVVVTWVVALVLVVNLIPQTFILLMLNCSTSQLPPRSCS